MKIPSLRAIRTVRIAPDRAFSQCADIRRPGNGTPDKLDELIKKTSNMLSIEKNMSKVSLTAEAAKPGDPAPAC
jgi:hypothetical protein